jgi:transposase
MTPEFDPNQLTQLPIEQLVRLIVQQQQIIEQLQQEVERLKVSLKLDSQTSSKPPSTDLLKKPEKPKAASDKTNASKRKPGGQPGHPGHTRKGFGRVDRYELLKPQQCSHCGSREFVEASVSVQRQLFRPTGSPAN